MRLFDRAAPQEDKEAFGLLYEQTHLVVYRFIYGLHGDPKIDVEDLTAETFIRAWNARHRFTGDQQAALGWLLKIARHLVIDAQRRASRRYVVALDEGDVSFENVSAEERAITKEKLEKLMSLLKTIPLEQRELLALRYILGWRVKDIAAQLDIPENTAAVKIRRTLDKLRLSWNEEAKQK
jgi:RNA polymerase sigma-70 factor (ECF subfamily)